MDIVIEHWRQIPDYPKYEVSTLGNVRHIKHKKILRGGVPYNGYRQVSISNNGARGEKTICVHQLVALTFLGSRPDGYEINHKDNNRLNNSLDNLEYIPWRENRGQGKSIEKICPVCHTKFKTYPLRPGETCSQQCHRELHNLLVTCAECGIQFRKKLSQIKRAKKDPQFTGNGERHFCSKQCQGKWAGKNYGWGRKNDTPLQHL